MEEQRVIEIFDHTGYRWVCSIYQNESYKNAPAFMRLTCKKLGFDKILESFNNEHTLIKVLKFITYYHYEALPENINPLNMSAETISTISDDPILLN